MANFKCRFNNEKFESMNNLINQNKKDHELHVSACRNFGGGYCEQAQLGVPHSEIQVELD